MIHDRIANIESKIHSAEHLPEPAKTELLALVSDLTAEIESLSESHREEASSIARFADVSTHEATRTIRKPQLIEASLIGLKASVEGFEVSHPKLTAVVNRLATVLSNMGI